MPLNERFIRSVFASRIPYHRDLEMEAQARGDTHGERRASRDATEGEAALCDAESRRFQEGMLTLAAEKMSPALCAMVFGR